MRVVMSVSRILEPSWSDNQRSWYMWIYVMQAYFSVNSMKYAVDNITRLPSCFDSLLFCRQKRELFYLYLSTVSEFYFALSGNKKHDITDVYIREIFVERDKDIAHKDAAYLAHHPSVLFDEAAFRRQFVAVLKLCRSKLPAHEVQVLMSRLRSNALFYSHDTMLFLLQHQISRASEDEILRKQWSFYNCKNFIENGTDLIIDEACFVNFLKTYECLSWFSMDGSVNGLTVVDVLTNWYMYRVVKNLVYDEQISLLQPKEFQFIAFLHKNNLLDEFGLPTNFYKVMSIEYLQTLCSMTDKFLTDIHVGCSDEQRVWLMWMYKCVFGLF